MSNTEDKVTNEVIINGEVELSTRKNTVTESTLGQNETAQDKTGHSITGKMEDGSNAYKPTDPLSNNITDEDYIPFYDVSEQKKHNTLFSKIIDRLKGVFLEKSNNPNTSISLGGTTIDLKMNNIDASLADNNVTSVKYPSTSNILDKAGRIMTRFESVVNPNGKIGAKIYVRNYNSNGDIVAQKGMQWHMDKSGKLAYQVDDYNAFREAIKTTDQIGVTIPNKSNLDNYKTAGTYAVTSDASAQTMFNIPASVSGKLIVSNNGDGGYTQFYVQNHEAKIFTRSFWNNAWSDWAEIGSGGGGTHTYQDGTAIAASSNLNSYTTAGVYKVATDAIAETLTNAPSNVAGKLIVYAGVGGGIEQSYMDTDNNEYTRVYDGTTWSDWKKGGSGGSVIFDDTTTVFDEDGDGLFHTYEVGLQIPANSDFNDYKTEGVYHIANNNDAATMTNCPATIAGKLIVSVPFPSTGNYYVQHYTTYWGDTYVRAYNGWNQTPWTEWIRIATSSNAYMLQSKVVTGYINGNDDLNNYTTAGTYDCRFASIASSLSNCPVTDAFKMMVDVEDNSKILTQTITIIHNLSSMPWRRTKNNSDTWSEWKQFSAGAHTYELGTELPSGADLNTYTTEGVYQCETNNKARTMSNLPYTNTDRIAFKLIVVKGRVSASVVQFYLPYHMGDKNANKQIAYRAYEGGTWNMWNHIANTDSSPFLGQPDLAHQITSNQDLNDFTESGTYQCNNANIATTLSNCPVGCSFKLIVDRAYTYSSSEILQRITLVHSNDFREWIRLKAYNSSTWKEWKQYATTSDITPAQVGNGYAVATVSGSAITATIDGFQLRAGAIVSLMFNSIVNTACTLNISNTGAKSVQVITGVNPAAGYAINNGINTFMYDGTYYRHLAHNMTPYITQQNYVANTSGNIILNYGYGSNIIQIKFRVDVGKLALNYYKNSTWRGDRTIAEYEDIVHQTLGTDIPDNANLNSYTTNGIYNISSNARADTITNVPVARAGKLIIQRVAANSYITQIYMTYANSLDSMDGIYKRYSGDNGSTWGGWISTAFIAQGNGMLYLVGKTTTEADKPMGIVVKITDTTTGKTYERQVIKWYQDHQTDPYGFNMVMDSGGGMFIGSGEAAVNHYNAIKPYAGEKLFITADNELYLQANANTIADRIGFRINNYGQLIPVKADVETDNSGTIGAPTMKLKNIYTYQINGTDVSDITNVANSIISNKSNSTAITSLDDVAINTAGILNLDAATSPINMAGNYIYICYGKDNQKTIELTRMTHGNKNTEERWYNAYNGSSWTGWMPLSRTGTYIGTCTTAADQQKKVASVDADFSLKKGVRVGIKFTNTNTFNATTSSLITLNVNSTGDKVIFTAGSATPTGTNTTVFGRANRYTYFIYDGTYWVWDGADGDNNSTYTPQSLGIGYGTNTEAATVTARAVTLSNYNLTTNGIIAVKFTNAVPAGATLNVNGKGAKSVYYRGVALKANVIKAGDIATFIYSGQYHLLGIDRTTAYDDLITGTGTAAQDKGSGVTNRYVPAKWTFDTGRTAAAGDIITIKIPVAGHDYGVFVSVDNGTNYIPVALNGTARLTTHFPINQTLQLVYEPDTTVNSVFPVAGGDARVNITGVWRVLNYRDSDTVDPCYLGFGYATCATAAATAAKVATLSNYTLRTGGYVSVKFTYDVPASATLNINSRGAKNIYYRGAAIKANIIKAGDIATFIYSGQYHLIGTDRENIELSSADVGIHPNIYNYITSHYYYGSLNGGQLFFKAEIAFKPTTAVTCAANSFIITLKQFNLPSTSNNFNWQDVQAYVNYTTMIPMELINNGNVIEVRFRTAQTFNANTNYTFRINFTTIAQKL